MLNAWLNRHMIVRRMTGFVALFVFFSCFILADARAREDAEGVFYKAPGGEPVQFARLDIDTFTIPAHLGDIKYTFKGSPDKFLIHLQDAHCNQFAQHKISDIIDYLNKEYGVRMVNLEGGVGDYDLTIFTSITGEAIRMEVADYFVKKGEINGAELYAITNPGKVVLWGVEDKDMYLANLKVYRDSLAYKEKVDKYLKELTHIMNNLKRHIYTPELLKIDMAYNAYKEENMDFREYLGFLVARAKEGGINIKQFTNLYLLARAMDLERRIDFEKADAERDALVDELKENLSRNEVRELVGESVDFKTRKISRKTFYDYLLEKAKGIGLDMDRFPAFSEYIVYVTTYETVDRSRIMEELADLETEIKGPLYRNDTQRRLDALSRNLAITKNIFSIKLNKTDYKYYLANKNSFDVNNYLEFIGKEAYKYRISARPSADILKLNDYREDISRFYEYSFKRDEIFLENLRFSRVAENVEGAVLMAGGFHTESLCELLEKKNISYVSILPRFTSPRDYKSPYLDLLAGQATDLERMLSSALAKTAMMQVASKLNDILGDAVYGRKGMDIFRAAVVLLRNLIEKEGKGIVGKVDDMNVRTAEDGSVECLIGNRVLLKMPARELLPSPITGNIAAGLSDVEILEWRSEAEARSDEIMKNNEDAVEAVKARCEWLLLKYEDDIRRELEKYGVPKTEIELIVNVLKNPTDPGSFKWFEARVEGEEKYMLGNENALAVNVIRHLIDREETEVLYNDLLDEYILHEALEKIPRLDHYAIIGLTAAVFDREGGFDVAIMTPGLTPLGRSLRSFIDAEVEFRRTLDDLITERWARRGDIRLRENLKDVLVGIKSLREADQETLGEFFGTHFDDEFIAYYARELDQQRTDPELTRREVDANMQDFIRDYIQVSTAVETDRIMDLPGRIAEEGWVIEKLTTSRDELEDIEGFEEFLAELQEKASVLPAADRLWNKKRIRLMDIFARRGDVTQKIGRALVQGLNIKRKIVPMPDVHADLEGMRDYLEGAGLVIKGEARDGTEDRWIGKDVTVVFMGDMIDRGPDPLDAMRYVRMLQKEAAEQDPPRPGYPAFYKGSRVVRLLGNHEVLFLAATSFNVTDRDRAMIYRKRMDKKLLSEEHFNRFVYELMDDIEEGKVVAAYTEGGKVFSHGVIFQSLFEHVKEERDRREEPKDTFTGTDFVDTANKILVEAVEQKDYSDPIFRFPGARGKVPVGLFWGYVTELSRYGEKLPEGLQQVVGHDPIPADLKTDPSGKVICVDTGMVWGGRKGLVFEDNKIYEITPPASYYMITGMADVDEVELEIEFVPITGEEAEELAEAQAEAAKGVVGDLRQNKTDIIVMPGSEIYLARQEPVNRATARKLHKNYGQETLPYSYKYGDDWKKNLEELMEKRIVPAFYKEQKKGKSPRMLLYLPLSTEERESIFEEGGLLEDYGHLEDFIAVILETDIPTDGVVDNVMHIVLAKSLLNYERFRKGDYGAEFSREAEMRLVDFLKTLVIDPTAMDLKKDPDVINKILNGDIILRIRPIDFGEIKEWKAAQDAVLKAL